jgi:hypothetical protein
MTLLEPFFFCPRANLPGFSLLVFCFGGSRGQKAGKKKVAAGKFWAKKKLIAKTYYNFYTNYPIPPPARSPKCPGSWCLTLTLGQPMYPNAGANIKGGIAV